MKCVACDKEAEYVLAGRTLCKKHFESKRKEVDKSVDELKKIVAEIDLGKEKKDREATNEKRLNVYCVLSE